MFDSITLQSIRLVDPELAEVDPGPVFFGSQLGGTPPPGPGPIPDLVPTSLTPSPDCGIDYQYEIRDAPLSRGTTIAFYWANGTTRDSIIGDAFDTEDTGTDIGSYTIHLDCATIGTPPPGADHILVVADPPDDAHPSGQVAEGDEAYGQPDDPDLSIPYADHTTTITVTSQPNPSVYGESVTFTARVSAAPPAAGTPTGEVDFFDGNDFLGEAELNGGVATLATADLTPGDHDITARYPGDDTFDHSDSDPYIQSVEKVHTAIIGSFGDSSVYGQPLTIDAIVDVFPPTPFPPTGTLTLLDSTTPIAGFDLSSGLVGADFSRNDLKAGLHALTVVYSGNDFFKSCSVEWYVEVAKAPLTVTADNQDMAHGDSPPPLTWTFTGFVKGETSAVVRGAPALSTRAASSSPAGHYPIDIALGSLAADNYSFQLDPGKLTVHPKVLDVRVHYGARTISLLGLDRDLPFGNITGLDVLFSDNVVATFGSLTLKSTSSPGRVYAGSPNYDFSLHDATWTSSTALGIDRLMLSLDPGLGASVDPSIKLLGITSWRFAVLPGDYDGDGTVTISDALAIRNQTPSFLPPGTSPSIWADLNGDGVVDLTDINLAKARVGNKLPPA